MGRTFNQYWLKMITGGGQLILAENPERPEGFYVEARRGPSVKEGAKMDLRLDPNRPRDGVYSAPKTFKHCKTVIKALMEISLDRRPCFGLYLIDEERFIEFKEPIPKNSRPGINYFDVEATA